MRLLVLGGTRFVGRAVVEAALGRGWEVTALHRGVTGMVPGAATSLTADRTDPVALRTALGGRSFDAVLDTWAGAPSVAHEAASVLSGRAAAAAYVSSRSVYAEWGVGRDETAPVVAGKPDAGAVLYPQDKRGGELAWLAAFPEVLLLRAGMILGPYEDVARLPWWLDRISRGGRVVAPGRPGRGLQYVDVRDLAQFVLDGLANGLAGPYDVVSRPGHCTMGDLLAACVEVTGSSAELVWFDEAELAAAEAQPWTQLPCWLPESGELAGFLASDTSKSRAAGLTCRPVGQTVADTWAWVQRAGVPRGRPGMEPGLPVELERTLLGTSSGPASSGPPTLGPMNDREHLLSFIRDLAVVHGAVTLSSGREANYYLDLRRITLSGLAAPLVGRVMLELTADWDYDAVGGLTMAADPIATAMLHAAAAQGRRLDAFVVRKEAKAHGLQRRVEGPELAGRRVLVVEDTTTTGGSPLSAIAACREVGAEVVGVATIADRATGAEEKIAAEGVPYRFAYSLADLGLS